jgi:hypothetical protein
VLAGFLVQAGGWTLVFLACSLIDWMDFAGAWRVEMPVIIIAALLPFAAVGYGLYSYFTLVSTEQRAVTIAVVGAFW